MGGVTAVDALDTMWLMGETFNLKLTQCAHPDPSSFTSKFDKVVSQIATLDFSMTHICILAVALRVSIVDTFI
jgi:hypothetical protein